MKSSPHGMPETLRQARPLMDEIARWTGPGPGQVERLTEALHGLYPSARACAALLRRDGLAHLHARDGSGGSRAEWVAWLHPLLDRPEETAAVTPPREMKLSGQVFLVEPITFRGNSLGALALAVPKKAPKATAADVRALLSACADHLGPPLHLEALERECAALREEREELAWLANLGEMNSAAAHEFNNFLNVIVLQVAVLEQQSSDDFQRQLAEIRRQAGLIKDLVKRLQDYRRGRPLTIRAVDLNELVRNEIAASRSAAGPFRMELADDLPPVQGPITALRRLVSFLLTNAAAAANGRGDVTVRTAALPGQVRLIVEDEGGDVDPERLNQLFEPCAPDREGTNGLEMAACKTIVRRLQGRIRADPRPGGGVTVTVELPAGSG